MAILRRRRPRNDIGMAPPSTQSAKTVTVEQSGARHIRELPQDQLDLVIESLRDGISLDALATYFSENALLTVSDKTFKQYLGAFRRVYPELITGEDEKSLNHIVSKRKPKLDEEAELEQLIRVQGRRIKIAVDFETTTSLPNQHLHKDINATRELIGELAKIRGKTTGAGRPSNNQPVIASNEAREQLRTLDQGEAAQDKLASLFGSLAPLLKARANVQDTKA